MLKTMVVPANCVAANMVTVGRPLLTKVKDTRVVLAKIQEEDLEVAVVEAWDIIFQSFFNGLAGGPSSSCEGKGIGPMPFLVLESSDPTTSRRDNLFPCKRMYPLMGHTL